MTGEKILPLTRSEGTLQYLCTACQAFMFKNEIHKGRIGVDAKFSTCCHQGKVQIPKVTEPPEFFQTLLIWTSKQRARISEQTFGLITQALPLHHLEHMR